MTSPPKSYPHTSYDPPTQEQPYPGSSPTNDLDP